MGHSEIGEELRQFAEESLNAKLTRLDYHKDSIGFSRMIWMAQTTDRQGATHEYIIRHDDGNGPFSLIPSKTIGHEGRLIAALHARGVAAPAIHAVSASGRSVIMEKLAGSAAFQSAGEFRNGLILDFAASLAQLHTLTVEDVFGQAPGEGALPGDLPEYHETYLAHCQPSSVLAAGLAWLAEHAPPKPKRRVIVHGDAGPGNFMFDGGRFTGLIDWEMAHVGDPMQDLSAIYFRMYVRGGGGDQSDWYRPCIDATGWDYEPRKVEYYRFAQFWRAAVMTELFKNHRSDIDPAIFAGPMKRVEAALRWADGDPLPLKELGFPEVPTSL